MRNFSILPYRKLRGKLRVITVTLPTLRTLATTQNLEQSSKGRLRKCAFQRKRPIRQGPGLSRSCSSISIEQSSRRSNLLEASYTRRSMEMNKGEF